MSSKPKLRAPSLYVLSQALYVLSGGIIDPEPGLFLVCCTDRFDALLIVLRRRPSNRAIWLMAWLSRGCQFGTVPLG